jgi:hypothetical protein
MQNTFNAQQQAARKQAQHYSESCEFMGMMGADDFDEEVEDGTQWLGLVRDENGMLQVHAQYVYDEGKDSGMGWWL